MSGSREIGVNPTELFRIQSQFFFCFTYYTCAAFNWLLLVTTEKLRIAGFFASSTFLTDLCNKRLKLSIHCVQLRTRLASLGPSFFRCKLAYLAVQKFVLFPPVPCRRKVEHASFRLCKNLSGPV